MPNDYWGNGAGSYKPKCNLNILGRHNIHELTNSLSSWFTSWIPTVLYHFWEAQIYPINNNLFRILSFCYFCLRYNIKSLNTRIHKPLFSPAYSWVEFLSGYIWCKHFLWHDVAYRHHIIDSPIIQPKLGRIQLFSLLSYSMWSWFKDG